MGKGRNTIKMSVIPTTTLKSLPPITQVKGYTTKEAFGDEKEKKSSTGRVFKLFSGFCDVTSLHGLGQVVANKSYLVKFLWSLAFILAIGGNSYHLSNLVQTYLSYPKQQVTTSDQKPIPFPGVSICNLEPFSQSNLANVSTSPTARLHKYNIRLNNMISNGTLNDVDMMEYHSSVPMLENIGIEEARQIGHGLEDFVLRCSFRGMPCNVTSDFKHFLNPTMFNCYTFSPGNATDNFNSVGQEYGLSLILYLETTTGIKTKAPYNIMTLIGNSIGARITIDAQGSSSLPHYKGIDVMPGHSTSISYKPQQIRRLGKPYGSCKMENIAESSNAPSRYDALVCIGECRQNFFMDRCKCKTSYEPAVNNSKYDEYPYCFQLPPGDDVEAVKSRLALRFCLMQSWFEFEGNTSLRAGCGCAPRCDDYNYPYSVSESKWPATQYLDSFLQYELRSRKDGLKAYRQLKTVS